MRSTLSPVRRNVCACCGEIGVATLRPCLVLDVSSPAWTRFFVVQKKPSCAHCDETTVAAVQHITVSQAALTSEEFRSDF